MRAVAAALLAALSLLGCGGDDSPSVERESAPPVSTAAEVTTTDTEAAEPEIVFPNEVDAAAIQDLLRDAAAHPARVRRLTPEARESLRLLRRYASQGVALEDLEEVGSAIARAMCELQLFREVIAELRRQGDDSWRTICDV